MLFACTYADEKHADRRIAHKDDINSLLLLFYCPVMGWKGDLALLVKVIVKSKSLLWGHPG